MKRILTLCLLTAALAFSGCEYDDGEIWGKVNEIDDRVAKLEQSVKRLNEEIEAIDVIVSAIEKGIFVENIETTEDGYRITFSDGREITVPDGSVSGDIPVIGVGKFTDGIITGRKPSAAANPSGCWTMRDT